MKRPADKLDADPRMMLISTLGSFVVFIPFVFWIYLR